MRCRGQAAVETVVVTAVATLAVLLVAAAVRLEPGHRLRGDAAPAVAVAASRAPVAGHADAVAVAESLLALTIRERGANRGPWIDTFTQGHAEAWCADFVSWVLRAAGHPLVGGIDGWRIAVARDVQRWFQERGRFARRSVASPLPGDVVAFHHGHVGIVVAVIGSTLVTIEGNASDAVSRRTYPGWRRWGDIAGIGSVT